MDQDLVEAVKPFDYECLPKVIKVYVEALAGTTDADPIILLVSFLGSLSGIVGKKIFLPEREWPTRLYANLWMLCIAESGLFKTTALNRGKRIASIIDREIRAEAEDMELPPASLEKGDDGEYRYKAYSKEEQEQAAAKARAKRRKGPFLPDRFSSEGLFKELSEGNIGTMFFSEFASFMKQMETNYNAPTMAQLTDFYDCGGPYECALKKEKYVVHEPYISICAVSTIRWTEQNIKLDHVEAGFFARFFLFLSTKNSPVPPSRPRDQSSFDKCEELEKQILETLRVICAEGREYTFSSEADAEFDKYHKEIYSIINVDDETKEVLGPFAKRWSPGILKVAMLLQPFFDPNTRELGAEAIRAGWAVIKFAIESTIYLFKTELGESEYQRNCRKVLTYIEKRGGEVIRQRLLSSHILPQGARQYKDVLDTLKQQGAIEVIQTDSAGKSLPMTDWKLRLISS